MPFCLEDGRIKRGQQLRVGPNFIKLKMELSLIGGSVQEILPWICLGGRERGEGKKKEG